MNMLLEGLIQILAILFLVGGGLLLAVLMCFIIAYALVRLYIICKGDGLWKP